jgi:spore coat protein H
MYTIYCMKKLLIAKPVLLAFVALLVTSLPVLSNDTIQINSQQYFIDTTHQLAMSNMDVSLVNATWTDAKTHIFLDELCAFSTPVTNVEIGVAYEVFVPSRNSFFTFYFTALPMLSISTSFEIVDEPYVQGQFKLIESDQNLIESYIGIQYRGGWTQTLPKKSMEIEFWTDNTGDETQDFSLLGLRSDDDWNLQAMYNEPLRLRSKTNNDLWRMIGTLHYQQSEPDAINGITMKYAELFLNNEYQGLYCIGEKIDRKQLKLKNHNGSIRGELYKGVGWDGATTFQTLPPYNNNSLVWGGFEYKHPDEETDWANLYDLVDFVINAPHGEFYEEYDSRFDIDNLVDYFIFLNLLRATDNVGKNIYIAKYTIGDKYFYAPWDLDGTFGSVWNGTYDPTTTGILMNGFYSRLMHDCRAQGFRDKLKDRWLQLRADFITHDSIFSMFMSSHDLLKRSGVYARESLVWSGFTYDETDLDYISDWMVERLEYLDVKFSEECISISVDESGSEHSVISIYPNPTNDIFSIYSDSFGEIEITIYNQVGQVMLKEVLYEAQNTISLAHLSDGVYFVKAEKQGRSLINKVVLVK